MGTNDAVSLRELIAFHDQYLINEREVESTAAEVLLTLARYQELLDRYPEQRVECALALDRMERYKDVIDLYPDQISSVALACNCCGLPDIDGYHRQTHSSSPIHWPMMENSSRHGWQMMSLICASSKSTRAV